MSVQIPKTHFFVSCHLILLYMQHVECDHIAFLHRSKMGEQKSAHWFLTAFRLFTLYSLGGQRLSQPNNLCGGQTFVNQISRGMPFFSIER